MSGTDLRVLVVDDDDLVRAAYRAFFGRKAGFVLCGEAADGAEGVEAYGRLLPDVVLMDLQLPVLDGVGAIREICTRWPGACVVAITTFSTRDHIVAALQAGAAGYLVKDAGADALVNGIRLALAGEMPLSGAVRRELVSTITRPSPPHPAGGVTPRERDVLRCLAEGMTNQQIGSALYLSEGTVKQYLNGLSTRLGATSRTQLLVRAIQLGLVDLGALPNP